MKIIITGGAGFIGGHAVKHFSDCGDEIINIDKLTYAGQIKNTYHSQFIKLDVCDTENLYDVVQKFEPDYIVNFAAETHVDNSIKSPKEFIQSNFEGATSVMNVCKRTNVPLCHISTDEVYGPADNHSFVETDSLRPMNPYSATKAAADLMLAAYRNTYGLDYIIVRPSNNYGPNQYPEKFIPKLIDCLKNNKTFPLYGSGDQEREWTYVADTVAIVRKLLVSEKTEWKNNSIYNLSSGISLTNKEAASIIIEEYNKKNKTFHEPVNVLQSVVDRPGHDRKYWISSDKLKNVIQHKFTEFAEGIKNTVL